MGLFLQHSLTSHSSTHSFTRGTVGSSPPTNALLIHPLISHPAADILSFSSPTPTHRTIDRSRSTAPCPAQQRTYLLPLYTLLPPSKQADRCSVSQARARRPLVRASPSPRRMDRAMGRHVAQVLLRAALDRRPQRDTPRTPRQPDRRPRPRRRAGWTIRTARRGSRNRARLRMARMAPGVFGILMGGSSRWVLMGRGVLGTALG